eukprot:TRINITY_DN2559_c0_g1_i5.p1 TRINITY_DN2559_c0_g1~~TRINITY_DN2559_c0_g1_i5.p1  ORF type:complete len:497 (+),score=42.70 TRINITY_DN2559_c0_g1_i5:1-1491(+)
MLFLSGVSQNRAFNRKLQNKVSQQKRRSPSITCKKVFAQNESLADGFVRQNRNEQDLQRIRKIINMALNDAGNPQMLLKVMVQEENIMDFINVSTAAKTIGHIVQTPKRIRGRQRRIAVAQIQNLLYELIDRHLESMDKQAVSNCLWCFGQLSQNFRIDTSDAKFIQVYEKLCKKSSQYKNYFNAQEIANCLWSFAKLDQLSKISYKYSFQMLIIPAQNIPQEGYRAQEIASILWSCGVFQFNDLNAIEQFVACSKCTFDQMDAQGISNFLWGLKELRYYDSDILEAAENALVNKEFEFLREEIAGIASCFAEFGLKNREQILNILIDQFIKTKFRSVNDDSQGFAHLIYCMTILQCPEKRTQYVVGRYLKEFRKNVNKIKTFEFRQLRRAQLEYEARGMKIVLPPDLQQKIIEIRKKEIIEGALKPYRLLDQIYTHVRIFFNRVQRRAFVLYNEVEIGIEIIQGDKKSCDITIICKKFNDKYDTSQGNGQYEIFF